MSYKCHICTRTVIDGLLKKGLIFCIALTNYHRDQKSNQAFTDLYTKMKKKCGTCGNEFLSRFLTLTECDTCYDNKCIRNIEIMRACL